MVLAIPICALIILATILLFYILQKKIRHRVTAFFILFLSFSVISMTLDLVSLILLENYLKLNIDVVLYFRKAYIISLLFVLFGGFSYTMADTFQYKKDFYIAFSIALLLVLGMSAYVVYLDLEVVESSERFLTHTKGTAVNMAYLFSGIAILLTSLVLIFKHKTVQSKKLTIMLMWLFIWVGFGLFQYLNPTIYVLDFGVILGFLVLYLLIENPAYFLVRYLGVFNYSAFESYIPYLYESNKDFNILIMKLNLKNNDKKQSKFLIQFINFINHLNLSIFEIDRGSYALINKSKKDLDMNLDKIKIYFANNAKGSSLLLNPEYAIIYDPHMFKSSSIVIEQVNYLIDEFIDNYDGNKYIVDQKYVDNLENVKRVEKLIDDAITNDLVEVYYQPIYSLRKRSFTSSEALIRLKDSEGKIIYPGTFIEVAENNGKIFELGTLVFEHVCKFISTHDLDYLGIHYIEVNLSVLQCADANLADNYINIMERYHVNPKYINLEITETGNIKARNTLLVNMKKLIRYGCTFSLDDFGTGNSNLNYLLDMPVNIVKFDMTMTRAYFENDTARLVMQSAISMIKELDLKIVVEGVEELNQVKEFRRLKGDYIQGYYYSKPLPSNEYVLFLKKNNVKEEEADLINA